MRFYKYISEVDYYILSSKEHRGPEMPALNITYRRKDRRFCIYETVGP